MNCALPGNSFIASLNLKNNVLLSQYGQFMWEGLISLGWGWLKPDCFFVGERRTYYRKERGGRGTLTGILRYLRFLSQCRQGIGMVFLPSIKSD